MVLNAHMLPAGFGECRGVRFCFCCVFMGTICPGGRFAERATAGAGIQDNGVDD
jgi:hypothetical protein